MALGKLQRLANVGFLAKGMHIRLELRLRQARSSAG